jgi:hypothetical protein
VPTDRSRRVANVARRIGARGPVDLYWINRISLKMAAILTCPRYMTGLLVGAACLFTFASCGEQRTVTPKAIAFEPTIVGCSTAPEHCTVVKAALLRESREARSHRCPADKPYVLIKPGGGLVCVTSLSSTGSPRRGVSVPQAVQARGADAIASFRAGEVVLFRSGCLACHRLGEAGNRGPGANLTHVGSRFSSSAINRALVDTRAPMPAFSGLPRSERRNLVYFLSQLG